MAIVVQKFGGSSLADVEHIGRVADLVGRTARTGQKLIVVVSAMGKTTETLLETADSVANFESGTPLPNRGALPRRELDMLVTSGERVSMALLSIALHARGVRAVSLTGSQAGIVTNTLHFDARIREVRRERILQELDGHDVVVVAGYQGVSPEREITTLGRGGSDTTAVALAAAFGAERCEIYSDVDGVYTADPKRVRTARHLPYVDYATLQEMTDAGAKVLNARAVAWGREHGVRIHARRTSDFQSGNVGRETRVFADRSEPLRAIVVNRALAILSARTRDVDRMLSATAELSLDVRDVVGAGERVYASVPLLSAPDFATARARLRERFSDGLDILDGYAELSAIGALGEPAQAAARAALQADAELPKAPLFSLNRGQRLTSILPLTELDSAERRWHQLFVEGTSHT
jgi:aspartate kinase